MNFKWQVLPLQVFVLVAVAMAGTPTPRELVAAAGIQPANGQRGQMDAVGFVTTAGQMDSVVAQRRLSMAKGAAAEPLAAAVCPHDDYYYASRLYAELIPRIHARTVILFGVFHKARVFDCRDKLVFDSFDTWRGPYGPVRVSPLRAALLARLPAGDAVVDNDMQMVEHSVEAIVPWLQAVNPGVEIVPILVPYMGWDTLDRLAATFSDALAAEMQERDWQLGRDVALICSADAVHYGDADWGGSNYADFGCDISGYEQAVARDRQLAASTLCGPVTAQKLEQFLYACVDRNDVMKYTIPWCGRFSVPFGLNVASRVSGTLGGRALAGTQIGYGTSVGEASLDLESIPGLGVTAPNNLHHWVGYPAIGYR